MNDGFKTAFVLPDYYKEKASKKWGRLYDWFLKLVFLLWGGEDSFRRRCVDFASPAEEDQVLDVCCGTGTLISRIAQRIGPDGQVIGVDLSEFMLDVAKKKTRNALVTLEKADAENLPFVSGKFDMCFLSFALHEMPKHARQNTLRETRRILRSGGRLFIVDYNLPDRALARVALMAFVKCVEDEAAYRLLLEGSLVAELEESAFVIKRRELICHSMIQLVEAMNP